MFLVDSKLATRSLAPGKKVYGEKTASVDGEEYRFWDPYRSKLSAAILNGLKQMPIKPGSSVLYLGAASGTTPSHVSDIVGKNGFVLAVEFAPRSMRDLLKVAEDWENIFPVMADARRPQDYKKFVEGKVDVVYEDVADPSQAEIMVKNSEEFLKKGGHAMIAIKSQSIDVSKKPEEVYEQVLRAFGAKFEILQKMSIMPYDKDHLFVLMRFR